MVNIDFPGVCYSCVEERCDVTPPDLQLSRERVHHLSEGFGMDAIQTMQDTFPDKFTSPEEAYQVYDALKAILANGLKNRDTVDLEGIGVFRTVPEEAHRTITFDSDPELTSHEHDQTPPDDSKTKELMQYVSGYTMTLLKVMRTTFPDKTGSLEEAYKVYYLIRAVLANQFEKSDNVEIEGIGRFQKQDGKVVYTPAKVLEDLVNE